MGQKPRSGDRVLIVEDVTTAGTSIRETVPKLRGAAEIELVGLVVSVDRRERGRGDRSALEELSEEFSMPTFSVVTVEDIIAHLHRRTIGGEVIIDDAIRSRMEAYLIEYGPRK